MSSLEQAATRWKGWLFEEALPLWTDAGLEAATGAFVEAVDMDGAGLFHLPRRSRVQPRQIYSVIEGGRLGWNGPWKQISCRALDWYLSCATGEDGTVVDKLAPDGSVLDPAFDLYNQAFVLFALAQVADAVPDRREDCEAAALKIMSTLEAKYRHPEAGFEEAVPPRGPLRANPHMHLLEAALAWESVSRDPVWSSLSDEIMELALARMIDRRTGALREFFSRSWHPTDDAAGRTVEPGHQFEWAWLALRWGRSRKRADAMVAARRLFAIGSDFGICAERRVAVLELEDDFTFRKTVGRLWSQTEWVKAALALARNSIGPERHAYLSAALQGLDALSQYMNGVPSGLWRDKFEDSGTFVDEPAPASSFYHIVCCISELLAFVRDERIAPT
jgi:mannose-6-phosphate isomerase